MRLTDFDVYRDLLREKAGLMISPDKTSLLDSRLTPVAKRWGYTSVEAMTLVLKAVPDKELVYEVIDAMSDHDTSFFQNDDAFQILKNRIAPLLLKNLSASKKIRLWSLGTSTGQEAYSLAMLFKEMENVTPGQIEILATDMSAETLHRAREGLYSQHEIQRGLPIKFMLKYFTKNSDGWKINAGFQKIIKFEGFNILNDMNKFGQFDVIFCQNLLHNLDKTFLAKILKNMALTLAKDGFLFVNNVADIPQLTDSLIPFENYQGVYKRPASLIK